MTRNLIPSPAAMAEILRQWAALDDDPATRAAYGAAAAVLAAGIEHEGTGARGRPAAADDELALAVVDTLLQQQAARGEPRSVRAAVVFVVSSGMFALAGNSTRAIEDRLQRKIRMRSGGAGSHR